MKRILILCTLIFMLITSSTVCFAANMNDIGKLELNGITYLPRGGVDEFKTYYNPNEDSDAEKQSDVVYTYGYQYTKGSMKYGSWRTGASGGSNVAPSTLSMTRSDDTSYDISFTASVSGSYTNGATIGSDLGVSLGKSKTYSLGSGYSVTVPKGKHYTIKYRPVYYTYTVVETKYMEQYVPGIGLKKWEVGSKTCYVDVFSHWDYTAE